MQEFVFIPNLLTKAETLHHIQLSEQVGFAPAAIRTATGYRDAPEIRRNQRLEIPNPELSQTLLARIKTQVSSAQHRAIHQELQAIYPLWRYYRYLPGDYFTWHRDGILRDSQGLVSRYTLLIYLNDDYQGGATQFRHDQLAIKQGSAVIFPHHLLHQSARLKQGTKYVLRSDLMYRNDLGIAGD